jgi:hypothetical protein
MIVNGPSVQLSVVVDDEASEFPQGRSYLSVRSDPYPAQNWNWKITGGDANLTVTGWNTAMVIQQESPDLPIVTVFNGDTPDSSTLIARVQLNDIPGPPPSA